MNEARSIPLMTLLLTAATGAVASAADVDPSVAKKGSYAARAWKICNTRCLRFLPAQNVKTNLPDGFEIRPAR